jgi:hypothetical protein
MKVSEPSLATTRPTPQGPAWLTSIGVHACLWCLLVLLLRDRDIRGASETSLRTAGLVLKTVTPAGPLFEGEDSPISQETTHLEPRESTTPPTDTPATRAELLAALPDEAELAQPGQGAVGEASPSAPAPASVSVQSAAELTQGRGSAGPIGGATRVRVFGLEGVGTKFVYAFDRSVSMEGPPLAAAKAQLIASLEALDSVHQFQIIFFNHELQVYDLTGGGQRTAFGTDRNKQLAAGFVRGITATGGTMRRTALLRALALQPDVIFFLTDADDQMPAGDLRDAIARARRSGTAIQTIEFGSGSNPQRENFLTQLARETGGQHVYIDISQLGR